MISKNIKFYLIAIFLIFNFNALAQDDEMPDLDYPGSNRHTLSRKQARFVRKIKRNSPSFEERFLAQNDENYKKHRERIKSKYKFPKREFKLIKLWNTRRRGRKKLKRLDRIEIKVQKFKNKTDTNIVDTKYKLTPEEKEILAKYENDPESLTKKEQKIYKKIQKKQEKAEEEKKKMQVIPFTHEDSLVMFKPKDSLTKADKKRLRQIKKIKKHNTRVRTLQTMQQGGYVPKKKFSMADLVPKFMRGKKKNDQAEATRKPSETDTMALKMGRLERKYRLTPKEEQAYNRAIKGFPLSPSDRIRAKRAARKKYLYEKKKKKLLQKKFDESQHKIVRKRFKEQRKKIKKRDAAHARKLSWINFKKSVRKIFKRKK